MKKIISLIKVSLNHDMNLFKIKGNKQGKVSKILIPLILALYLMFLSGMYSENFIKVLKPFHLEYIVLTIFSLAITFLTLLEGIYKSSSLLFNCKDDSLLLSLPIKKSTVLFIRIFKFYAFEFLYNTLFLLPAMIVYAIHIVPSYTYYISSIIALIILPIIPIILSCIIGFITTYLSSKFKGKNLFQTIFSIAFVLIILYISYNIEGFTSNIAEKASSINDYITKLYYPVGAYISLVTNFKIRKLLIYLIFHMVISILTIIILGKLYFKINSSFKKVITTHKNNKYKIKNNSKEKAFIKKEINKFFSTPVFVTNAGFGLILYILACILCTMKFDSIANDIIKSGQDISLSMIYSYLPTIMFALICFTSFMTSITSSMISLEGKSFNILKSLPLKPTNIVMYKVLAALTIMIPCIIFGDIIIFIKFKFNIISIFLLLIASVVLPFISELIGIIINLKYPKINATNDTEIVKQSMSALIATFTGMGLTAITAISIFALLNKNITNNIIITIVLIFYIMALIPLLRLLNKNCDNIINKR